MTATERQIRLAAQLYETRDTVRLHLGDRYHERMEGFGQVIKGYAASQGVGLIEAATAIGKDPALSPFTVLFVLAAAVELVEPSTH